MVNGSSRRSFPWPGDGGIRLMLVATPKGGDAPPPVFQPQPGNVVLGDETRVIIDHADDALQVYYILDIQNNARDAGEPAIRGRRQHAGRARSAPRCSPVRRRPFRSAITSPSPGPLRPARPQCRLRFGSR